MFKPKQPEDPNQSALSFGEPQPLDPAKENIHAMEFDLPPIFSPGIMRLSPVCVRLHQRCS